VHADDPEEVLFTFYRLLKPGGVLVLHEYELKAITPLTDTMKRLGHMPGLRMAGSLETMLGNVGFVSFDLEDLYDRVLPLWRLLGVLAYVPYQLFRILGIQERFVNTMTAAESWFNRDKATYVSIRVEKPEH